MLVRLQSLVRFALKFKPQERCSLDNFHKELELLYDDHKQSKPSILRYRDPKKSSDKD
jgi:hypothetical protein